MISLVVFVFIQFIWNVSDFYSFNSFGLDASKPRGKSQFAQKCKLRWISVRFLLFAFKIMDCIKLVCSAKSEWYTYWEVTRSSRHFVWCWWWSSVVFWLSPTRIARAIHLCRVAVYSSQFSAAWKHMSAHTQHSTTAAVSAIFLFGAVSSFFTLFTFRSHQFVHIQWKITMLHRLCESICTCNMR